MAESKKFKSKQCVYCREELSSTADHVFPREITAPYFTTNLTVKWIKKTTQKAFH